MMKWILKTKLQLFFQLNKFSNLKWNIWTATKSQCPEKPCHSRCWPSSLRSPLSLRRTRPTCLRRRRSLHWSSIFPAWLSPSWTWNWNFYPEYDWGSKSRSSPTEETSPSASWWKRKKNLLQHELPSGEVDLLANFTKKCTGTEENPARLSPSCILVLESAIQHLMKEAKSRGSPD